MKRRIFAVAMFAIVTCLWSTGLCKAEVKHLSEERLNEIIIPIIDFNNVTLTDAIEFLRIKSAELDHNETQPGLKGVNFFIHTPDHHKKRAPIVDETNLNIPAEDPGGPVIAELKLRNVPLGSAIKHICNTTKMQFIVSKYAVVIFPSNTRIDQLKPTRSANANNHDTRKTLHKSNNIIIPAINFEDTQLDDAAAFLTSRAAELDDLLQPHKPLKIQVDDIADLKLRRIPELRVRNVPLSAALDYVCRATNTRWKANSWSIRIFDPEIPAVK